MKLALRRNRLGALPGVKGVARIDRSTRALAGRLRPGEVAIIDHLDLDRAAAEALLARGVAAVVNVSASSSGRYPNLGPNLIVAAGVPLVDSVGSELFGQLREGEPVRVWAGGIYDRAGTLVASGFEQTPESVSAQHAQARAGLAIQLEAFAADTAEFLRRDPDLLDGPDSPQLSVDMHGRHALVVAGEESVTGQFAALKAYRRERKPVIIGVDAGLEVLARAGVRPDVALVTNPADVDAERLRRAGEIVVRIDPNADPWALWTVQELGLSAQVFRTAVSSEDAGVLLAVEAGAEVVVTAGVRTDLVGLLDRGRGRLASSFLTGLRAGTRVVDASAAAALHRPRIGLACVLLLLVCAAAALAAAVAISPAEAIYAHWISAHWHGFLRLLAHAASKL
ncbi:MAG: putative cytokinetic ring protein SteA [Mycobacteriales bacterium]